ncbi:unnamed protein product, partial [marine sediment metagenome]
GMLLDLDYGEKYARMVFASSDHSDNSLHPELILNYYNTEKVNLRMPNVDVQGRKGLACLNCD